MKFRLLIYVITICLCSTLQAQNKQQNKKKSKSKKMDKSIFKDSLDGKLDVSQFLLRADGFIPVPQLITEPALGSFGLMIAPVFIHPNKVQEKGNYIPPNITAGFAGYTANNSWMIGAMRIASLPKQKLKYRVGAGYGDINMDFYREIAQLGEQKFEFNFKSVGVFGSILRELGNSDAYLGIQYIFLKNDLTPKFNHDPLPDFLKNKDFKSNLSSVGLDFEFDKRDNVFTPNKGWYITSTYTVNANWTGSDYDYENLDISVLKFFQFSDKWVGGFRFETMQQFGDAPFYMVPSINLRGVPMRRYQGDQTYVVETEQRYDITKRWSAVVFAGLGKAPTPEIAFDDATLVHNVGTGFRYLIARKFGLRTGVDVAWSNNDFGWYVIFGHAWNNRN